MKRQILIIISVILLGTIPAAGNPVLNEEADRVLEKYTSLRSPGVVIAVFRNNGTIYKRALGMADLERKVPLDENSVFHLASCGKQFTGFAIRLLEERGLLSLNDNIRKYIPAMPRYGKTIRLRHLLYHTSGIRDYAMMLLFSGRRWINFYPVTEILELITSQKGLNNRPGEEFIYSNSNYYLLGLVIEKVSGMTQREFLEKNVFSPLKMDHTRFSDTIYEIIPRRALGYSPGPEGGFIPEISLMVNAGDGSVFSTVEDLIRWQNCFDAGIPGICNVSLMDKVRMPGSLNNGKNISYASGLYVGKYRGLVTVSHGGGWAGYRSETIRFPEQRVSVVSLSNLGTLDTRELSLKIADIFLKGKFRGAKKPPSPPADRAGRESLPQKEVKADLNEFTGTFYSEELKKMYRIIVSEGKLKARIAGLHFDLILIPDGKDRFRTVSPAFRFVRDQDGMISGFFMGEYSARNISFTRTVPE